MVAVMMAAGLIAKRAVERGLLVKPYVKGVVLTALGMSRIPFDRMWMERPPADDPEKR